MCNSSSTSTWRVVTSSGRTLAVVVLLLFWAAEANAMSPQDDPALCLPGFAELARQYPQDWEQRVHPTFKPMIEWQRIIGTHALIVGWSDEDPNPGYPNPRVVIHVARWDGSDLFALGLPRTHNGKPVVINDVKDIPQPAAGGNVAGGLGPVSTPLGHCPNSGAGKPPDRPRNLPRTGTGFDLGVLAIPGLLLIAGGLALRLALRPGRGSPR